mgnify:CR=1 FL=1
MVYLATPSYDGRAVYFEPYVTERTAAGLRICGTIGDGQYEGEVLVEFEGARTQVTFADSWLGGVGFREFAERCNIARLGQELVGSLESFAHGGARRDFPHGGEGGHHPLHSWVCESRELWQGVA